MRNEVDALRDRLRATSGLLFHAWWVEACLAHLRETERALDASSLFSKVLAYAYKASFAGIVQQGCLPPDVAEWGSTLR